MSLVKPVDENDSDNNEVGGRRDRKRKKDLSMQVAKIDDLFAEPPKTKSVKTGVYIPEELLEVIRESAKASGRSVNEVMVKVLTKFFMEK